MGVRFLLDEHVEHEVFRRLRERGYGVEHVGYDDSIERGSTDAELASASRKRQLVIVTYDDDFVGLSEEQYHCVLLFEDENLPPGDVVKILERVTTAYPESQFRGLQKLGREWL